MKNIKDVLNYIFQHEEKDFDDNERPTDHVYARAMAAEDEVHSTETLANEVEVLIALISLREPSEGTKRAIARVQVAMMRIRGVL